MTTTASTTTASTTTGSPLTTRPSTEFSAFARLRAAAAGRRARRQIRRQDTQFHRTLIEANPRLRDELLAMHAHQS